MNSSSFGSEEGFCQRHLLPVQAMQCVPFVRLLSVDETYTHLLSDFLSLSLITYSDQSDFPVIRKQ